MGKTLQIAGFTGEIVSERYNPLVKRREIVLRITHIGTGTPNRGEVRREIARLFNVNIDQVYVKKIETEYGIGVSNVKVFIYNSAERARMFEPEYIIKRNEEAMQKVAGQQSNG
ncbi:30S ribosomal protein S24e [Thermogladius sp. 4427co]|uniref:30S ribosomal protein S24e n=1 Tax=Thermogladius sp. 4427co TaxID=3450718 RepID=UPI003F79CB71